MAWYVDTSAFLKLVVSEEHTSAFRSWATEEERVLFSSDLLRTEALRVARRHSPHAAQTARDHLDVLTLVRLPTSVFERAAELDSDILRTLDAVHLAAALSIGDELSGLVTYDARLADAATIHGVAVVTPKQP
jgi:predicted nucleic acid-binding protein